MRRLLLSAGSALVIATLAGDALWAGDIKGKVSAEKKKHLPHTIVYVDGVSGEFKAPKEHPVMDQKNLVFVPHVLPVLAGTTVDFLNSDQVAHNVFTPDRSADKFNLGTWPTGETKSFTFEKRCDKVCDAVMLCNVHPEMEAYVVIMQNPYFTRADEEGKFQITGVPAGDYFLKVWHPKQRADSQKVTVPAEGAVAVELTLTK
ncbi:MAG TPA: carboxypeptidase regulatory-like domain-containing protein [Candidatus Deferrimicrobium sp.]|nr:carboxypeptidase regulatory-like domain-containing protein [Candidatus Deferrimicrobium sp.]